MPTHEKDSHAGHPRPPDPPAGTPDRLVLSVSGDSCQDGAGPPSAGSVTGLARFKIKGATGTYAGAAGNGLATLAEDAADHDRMTLVGHISR